MTSKMDRRQSHLHRPLSGAVHRREGPLSRHLFKTAALITLLFLTYALQGWGGEPPNLLAAAWKADTLVAFAPENADVREPIGLVRSNDEVYVSAHSRSSARPASKLSWAEAFIIAAASADIITTEWALSQPNVYEGNPLGRNRGVRITSKAGAVAATIYLTRLLERRGHPTAAKWARRINIGVWGGAAVWNLTIILD